MAESMTSRSLAVRAVGLADVAPRVRIALTERRGWQCHRTGPVELWLKGWPEQTSLARLAKEVGSWRDPPDACTLDRWLASLHGHFAIVARAPGWAFAAVDRIRSIPLIWGRTAEGAVIAQEAAPLVDALGLGPDDADSDASMAVGMSGFSIGDDTVYRGVRQLGPGQFLLLSDGTAELELGRYHRFMPWRPSAADRESLRRGLADVTLKIFSRLIDEADGRPIAVPLSAGRDSRLVVSSLVHLGYRNIVCFAYGLSGNHEAETSRRVAETLGLDWRFLPYSPRRMKDVFQSEDHRAYVRSADSLTRIHFPQEYLALRELKQAGFLPDDALIVNGQSGDFITGNHVPEALHDRSPDASPAARRARVIGALVAKHYQQWNFLQASDHLARIGTRLKQEIEAVGGMPADASGDHGIYEWCEFQDRQSKYVINGQRVYEHFGHDWRLPLWADDYLDFWQAAPLDTKIGQSLFVEMLESENWGGVWCGVPINVKTIRPRWLKPIRLAAKIAHAPLGRGRWYSFERRVFGYWMDNLCTYAVLPYSRAVFDSRDRRNGLAYHNEAYLRAKGLELDGRPLGAAVKDVP